MYNIVIKLFASYLLFNVDTSTSAVGQSLGKIINITSFSFDMQGHEYNV